MIILPTPKDIKIFDEKLTISESFRLINNSYEDLTLKATNKLKRDFPDFRFSNKGTVIEFIYSELLKDEEYKIVINQKQINIKFNTEEGCFNAVCTLKQILLQAKNNEINTLEIFDFPDFKNRGLMLDISRNRVYSVETICHIVDLLSDLKLNQLQLNVEGNSFYYPSKDKYYFSKDDYFTTEDIIKINEHCIKNGVRFIPNQNSFGHMCYWLNQDEFNHLAECPEGFTYRWMVNSPSTTLNPTNPESFEFVKGLYDEILPGFTEKTFNIGADEPFELGFGKSKELVEKVGKPQVYIDFILKLYNYLADKGFQIMMWGDVIKNHPEILNHIPKDIIALEWGYDALDFSDEELQKYTKNGFNFYVCPGTSMWNSVAGIHQNMIANIKRAAKIGKRNGAIGLLNTDWGDGGSWQQLSLSYFPYLMGCVYSWNSNTEQDELILDYLDKFVYQDEEQKLSRFLKRLGMYSTIECEKESNATMLFKLLYIQQTDHINFGTNYNDPMFIIKDPRKLSNEEYLNYVDFFTEMLKEFSTIDFNCNDKEIIKEEILFTLKILLVGSKLGVYQTDLYCHDYDEFVGMRDMLKEAINHYEYAWLKRNKRSDLHLSILRMKDLLNKFNAILKCE